MTVSVFSATFYLLTATVYCYSLSLLYASVQCNSCVHSRNVYHEASIENYIVRNYRRDDELKDVASIVEIVDMQEEKHFKSLEELLTILNATKVGAVIKWDMR